MTQHTLCDACETVALCLRKGCIPETPVRIDWFRVLMDLKRAGLSLESISNRVGVSKSAVIGWKNLYAEPKHVDGERLIALWSSLTGKDRRCLPTEAMVGIPTAAAQDTRPT